MNILILAAHPDDETLGCGGTIKNYLIIKIIF
jgi:LmbE family N-acetylglucosaminyl deacetylase